jgi:hypothetical protein
MRMKVGDSRWQGFAFFLPNDKLLDCILCTAFFRLTPVACLNLLERDKPV